MPQWIHQCERIRGGNYYVHRFSNYSKLSIRFKIFEFVKSFWLPAVCVRVAASRSCGGRSFYCGRHYLCLCGYYLCRALWKFLRHLFLILGSSQTYFCQTQHNLKSVNLKWPISIFSSPYESGSYFCIQNPKAVPKSWYLWQLAVVYCFVHCTLSQSVLCLVYL